MEFKETHYSGTENHDPASCLDECIHYVRQMTSMACCKAYVIDFHQGNIPFLSINGYDIQNRRFSDIEAKLHELITDQDLNRLMTIDQDFLTFLNQQDNAHKTEYSLIFNIPIQFQGDTILLYRRLTPYALDSNGDVWLAVGVIHISPFKNKGESFIIRQDAHFHFEWNNSSWEKTDNPTLTDKEWLILSLACRGFTTKDISGKINRSEATVKTHKNDILRKLKVSNMTEASHVASVFGML